MTIADFYNRCQNCYSGSKILVYKALQEVYYGSYKDMDADIKSLPVGTFSVDGSNVLISCEEC